MGCAASSSVKDRSPRRPSGFRPIPDRFTSIEQVQQAVRAAGLESSNLILGVDFTKSNSWTGMETFQGRNMHDTTVENPYMNVIDVIGRTLEPFDDDRLIPTFGFGDATTGDKACFPFLPNGKPAQGVNAVLERYKQVANAVALSGPTSFAPVIREAINIVREEESYHILVIIADGQVTDAGPTGATAKAIIEASNYPLSIVVVGVGDGPWQAMEHYDDELPARRFDNFQFVEWNAVKRANHRAQIEFQAVLDARFALAALMEIPDQYLFIKQAGLLNPSTWPRPKFRMTSVPSPLPEYYTPNVSPTNRSELQEVPRATPVHAYRAHSMGRGSQTPKPMCPATSSNETAPPAYTPSIVGFAAPAAL